MGVWWSYLFSQLSLLKQTLPVPTIKPLPFLAKLKAMSTIAVVLLMCLFLMLKILFLSYFLISLSLFYFPFNAYLNLLLFYITIQYFLKDVSLPSTFSILLYLIFCLKSSINGFLSYLPSLAVLLNFCTNFSIILLLYSTFFNSATFNISLSSTKFLL